MGRAADSLDVEEIFALLIEGIEVVPEKIRVCFGSISTRLGEGPIAKGHTILSGLRYDTSITEYSPSGAGINPCPSPTVVGAKGESRVLVGGGKESAFVGSLRPGGRGIVVGPQGRGHALPIEVKGRRSIRPSGDLLRFPVDQNTRFSKAKSILRGELDSENWAIVAFPVPRAVNAGLDNCEGRDTDLCWILANVVGLVANRGLCGSAPPKPDRFAVDTLVKQYGIACLGLELRVGDGCKRLGAGSWVGIASHRRGGNMKFICCLRQNTGSSEEKRRPVSWLEEAH